MIPPKLHWDKIYSTKSSQEVSWTQETPKTSLDFIHQAQLDKSSRIIDIGGGDSMLVDYLIEEGFEHITVLDISEAALLKAKNRLGSKANNIHWIISDIQDFVPSQTYDFWHDRATFHFLTTQPQIHHYLEIAKAAVRENGFVTIGTFSKDGPDTCSGLNVVQYDEPSLTAELQDGFDKIKCITEDHITPFQTLQNFLFCSFRRISATATS
jgi:SAM-dependent methyltransferase